MELSPLHREIARKDVSKSLKIGIPIALAVSLLAYLILSLGSLDVVECEVCVEFQGRTDCRRASGPTEEAAIRTGTDNACALLGNGRDELITCGATPPVSVSCTAR